MLHGDAVAIGMVVECEIATRLGIADRSIVQRVTHAVARAGLPTSIPSGLNLERVLASTYGDKKVRSGVVRYALPKRIGEMTIGDGAWSVSVSDDVVLAALGAVGSPGSPTSPALPTSPGALGSLGSLGSHTSHG